MTEYPLTLEVSGATAMWTRPDTGDAPVSYPAPTFSAVKGIFESILWQKSAEVVPTKVEICAPLLFHTYVTNYRGPLREPEQVKGGTSRPIVATVLINVCYRFYAVAQTDKAHLGWYDGHRRAGGRPGRNGAHAYADRFERRILRGQSAYVPSLGWREFVPDYVGSFRDSTRVCNDIGVTLPSMLHQVFPDGKGGRPRPVFKQNVKITKGVLVYAQ